LGSRSDWNHPSTIADIMLIHTTVHFHSKIWPQISETGTAHM